jgi:hypothetical protein
MLRTRWLLHLLTGAALLETFHLLGAGKIRQKDLPEKILDEVAREQRDAFGRWPLHQEQGTRPPTGLRPDAQPLVVEALAHLARRFLCWHAGAIELRPDRLLEWREDNAHLLDPELPMLAAAALEVWADPERLRARQVDARVLHQVTDAPVIPPVALPVVEGLRGSGLTEMHRHLSLARLPAHVWSGFLSARTPLLSDALDRPTPYENWSHLRRHACALRSVLVQHLLHRQAGGATGAVRPAEWRAALRRPSVVRRLQNERAVRPTRDGALQLTGASPGKPLSRERALVLHTLQAIVAAGAPPLLGPVLHTYLLLRQLCVRSILQPPAGRKGLDRFKSWYVDSGWHDLGGASATRDGAQQAWRTGGVRWLEGKVSPSRRTATHLARLSPPRSSRPLLARLLQPSPTSRANQTALDSLLTPTPSDELPAIRLTFHFLREPEPKPPSPSPSAMSLGLRRVNFASLRAKVHRQALGLLDDASDRRYAPFVVGLDVASMETTAPIEVFAPILRAMRSPWVIPPVQLHHTKRARRTDFGLSVHAGEEFRHLAEGIRRVDETLEFCGYRAGDRLGHALALGIEPTAWADRWQGTATMPRRVRLDDVVWMWRRLEELPGHAPLRVSLEAEARRLHRAVYGQGEAMPDMDVLESAWRLRAEDPMSHGRWRAPGVPILGRLRRPMHRSLQRALRSAPPAAEELWWRTLTDPGVRQRGDEPIDVELKREELTALRELQDLLLRRLVRDRVVIEVNPSSNLAIGPFDRISEHPIFRWAPPTDCDEGHRPIVVVGSDDPAIFGTELLHEYALLARAAEERGADRRAIASWLQELDLDAQTYRFDEQPS